MKWNKLTLRELTEEEQEEYGYETLWDGNTPKLGQKVVVAYPMNMKKSSWCEAAGIDTWVEIDTWIEFDNGVGFEYTDEDVIYWAELPEYNGELDN